MIQILPKNVKYVVAYKRLRAGRKYIKMLTLVISEWQDDKHF